MWGRSRGGSVSVGGGVEGEGGGEGGGGVYEWGEE